LTITSLGIAITCKVLFYTFDQFLRGALSQTTPWHMYDSKCTDTQARRHTHTHTSYHLSLTNSLEVAMATRIKIVILYACYVALINPRSIFIVIEAIHA